MKNNEIKTVVPEVVALITHSDGNAFEDYRCPECGGGVADYYSHCMICGSKLDWDHVEHSANFKSGIKISIPRNLESNINNLLKRLDDI